MALKAIFDPLNKKKTWQNIRLETKICCQYRCGLFGINQSPFSIFQIKQLERFYSNGTKCRAKKNGIDLQFSRLHNGERIST